MPEDLGPKDFPRHEYMEKIVKKRLKNLKDSGYQGDTRWVQFHYPKVNPKSGKVDDSRELLLSKAKLDATLEETRKRLEGVRVNEPTTFGGKFNKEEDKSTARLYREIVTSTPPDITRETRVVAVCGVQQFEAMPSKDGWIVADMMLLYALLGGTSTSQQWLHCLKFPDLIEKYGSYTHGNPYSTRKEVLNNTIYDEAMKSRCPLKYVQNDYEDLFDEFLLQLKLQANEARKNNQPLLILIFAHAMEEDGKVSIGGRFLGIERIQRALGLKTQSSKGPKLQVTLVSTACFSGGWLARADLGFDVTGQASALEKGPSMSWRRTASSGQYPGSMVSSALAQTLVLKARSTTPLDPDDESLDLPRHARETYAEFTKEVHNVLLSNLDRYASQYGAVSFSAQNDLWEWAWGRRTGYPLDNFKVCWDNLVDFEPDKWLHPGDWQNRDPNVSKAQRDEYLDFVRSYEAYIARFPGSEMDSGNNVPPNERLASRPGNKRTSHMMEVAGVEAVKSHIGKMIDLFTAGKPGSGDAASLHEISSQIQDFNRGLSNETFLNELLENLDYHLGVIAKADRYVAMLGLSSDDITCTDWDDDDFGPRPGDDKHWRWLRQLFWTVSRILFPTPVGKSGIYNYAKGGHFVMTAIYKSGWSSSLMESNLNKLAAIVMEEDTEVREVIKKDPNIRNKRQRVKEAFGSSMRDISPERSPPRQGYSENTPTSRSRRRTLSSGGPSNPVVHPGLGLSSSGDSPSKRSPGRTPTSNPRLGQSPQDFPASSYSSNNRQSSMLERYGPPAFDLRQQQHRRRSSNLRYQHSETDHQQPSGSPSLPQNHPGAVRQLPGSSGLPQQQYRSPSRTSQQFGGGSRQSSTSPGGHQRPQGGQVPGSSSGNRAGDGGNQVQWGSQAGQGQGGSPGGQGRGGYQGGQEGRGGDQSGQGRGDQGYQGPSVNGSGGQGR